MVVMDRFVLQCPAAVSWIVWLSEPDLEIREESLGGSRTMAYVSRFDSRSIAKSYAACLNRSGSWIAMLGLTGVTFTTDPSGKATQLSVNHFKLPVRNGVGGLVMEPGVFKRIS